MALVVSNPNPTLLDFRQAQGMDERIGAVIELLAQSNPILDDITFMPTSRDAEHRTMVRTGLPAPTWRKLYGGVHADKSSRAQVTESVGMLSGYMEIDAKEAEFIGDDQWQMYRASEAMAWAEGFGQTVATNLFYGDTALNPERFNGLSTRFNTVTQANAQNAQNVINMGSDDADNRSIWLVCWGPDTVMGLFPKNAMAGLRHRDLGEQTREIDDGTMMQVIREYWEWDLGLCVKDWRYVVRICNIDISDLKAKTGDFNVQASNEALSRYNAMKLDQAMKRALRLLPNTGSPTKRPVFYMDRETLTGFEQIASYAVGQSTLKYENLGGRIQTSFMGVPIRQVDALAVDEARVT